MRHRTFTRNRTRRDRAAARRPGVILLVVLAVVALIAVVYLSPQRYAGYMGKGGAGPVAAFSAGLAIVLMGIGIAAVSARRLLPEAKHAAAHRWFRFLPVASALRRAFPAARIGWVVQDKARAIVAGHPDLDGRPVGTGGAAATAGTVGPQPSMSSSKMAPVSIRPSWTT